MRALHRELHRTDRIGWLRAAVLGANDGIVSTASLVVGVASAQAASSEILVAGVAGLAAGAMSMAAGEYVSVNSQADTEQGDLARERKELSVDQPAEHRELAATFAVGAAMPLLTAIIVPPQGLIPVVIGKSVVFLALLGGFGAYAGGAPGLTLLWGVAFAIDYRFGFLWQHDS